MPIIRYPEDLTGINPDNRIANEIHTVHPYRVSRPRRIVIPNFRPFFTDTAYLQVYDLGSSTPLTPLIKDVDYKCVEISEEACIQTGKEVCQSIIIENIHVTTQVAVSYQTIGGLYTSDTSTLVNLLNSGLNDTRPVHWDNLTNKPFTYDPAPHLHHLNDVVGYAPLIVALERLHGAITLGNSDAFENLTRYLNNRLDVHVHPEILQLIEEYNGLSMAKLYYMVNINNHTHPRSLPVTPVPVYTLSASPTTVNEGAAITYTLSGTNMVAGTNVPFTLSGMVAGVDYTVPAQTSFVVGSTQSVTVTTLADATTDDNKTLTMTLTGLGIAASTAVIDSSQGSGAVTYTLTASPTTVNEGSIITYTLASTNGVAGTNVPFTLSGMTAGLDYTVPSNSSFVVGSRMSIVVTTLADATTDGNKTLTMTLTGMSVSASATVTDSSRGSVSYNIGDVVGNFPGTSNMYLNLTYNANSDDIWATSGSNSIYRIKADRSGVINTYNVGVLTTGIVYAPDKNLLYVSDANTGNILVINPSSGSVGSSIFIGVDLGNIDYDAATQSLWVFQRYTTGGLYKLFKVYVGGNSGPVITNYPMVTGRIPKTLMCYGGSVIVSSGQNLTFYNISNGAMSSEYNAIDSDASLVVAGGGIWGTTLGNGNLKKYSNIATNDGVVYTVPAQAYGLTHDTTRNLLVVATTSSGLINVALTYIPASTPT